jgi:hypothetical protein
MPFPDACLALAIDARLIVAIDNVAAIEVFAVVLLSHPYLVLVVHQSLVARDANAAEQTAKRVVRPPTIEFSLKHPRKLIRQRPIVERIKEANNESDDYALQVNEGRRSRPVASHAESTIKKNQEKGDAEAASIDCFSQVRCRVDGLL